MFYSHASSLSAALKQAQIDVEAEKSALVGALHDDLGGLLVGAIMDMGWISAQTGLPDVVRDKVVRARGLLGAAIDLKRQLIENLRPTLLDNIGLFSTLRWHMKASCNAASVAYTEIVPFGEQAMTPEIRIGVFRIFQEALNDVLAHSTPGELSLKVEVTGDTLHCHLDHRNDAYAAGATDAAVSRLTSLHQRAKQVGGSVCWSKANGRRHMHLEVPLTTH